MLGGSSLSSVDSDVASNWTAFMSQSMLIDSLAAAHAMEAEIALKISLPQSIAIRPFLYKLRSVLSQLLQFVSGADTGFATGTIVAKPSEKWQSPYPSSPRVALTMPPVA